MKNVPKGGLIGKAVHLIRWVISLRIPLYAANAGYFIVLAVFPTLVLLLGLLRYTGLQVQTLTELLDGWIPDALMPAAKRLILSTYQNTSGTVISVSAVTALWSASRGMFGIVTGLNGIYGVEEDRGWLRTRLLSVVYTFAFLLVLLLTLVLQVFGHTLVSWLPLPDTPLLRFVWEVVDLRFFLLLGLQTLLFTAMFMVLPNKRNRFAASLPGALLAACGWLVFSDLYSIYVTSFTGFTNIYGSVYAVALSMLWLYSCLSIVFYGGALNHYLMDQKKH